MLSSTNILWNVLVSNPAKEVALCKIHELLTMVFSRNVATILLISCLLLYYDILKTMQDHGEMIGLKVRILILKYFEERPWLRLGKSHGCDQSIGRSGSLVCGRSAAT